MRHNLTSIKLIPHRMQENPALVVVVRKPMKSSLLFTLLGNPGKILLALAKSDTHLSAQVQRHLPLLLLLPPVCAALGGLLFGWRLGPSEPLYLDSSQALIVSVLYLLVLCFGFFSTVLIARWMGNTYGAEARLEDYVAFFVVVCAPLAVAGIAHLFPQVFFNVLVLIPCLIWSMVLLYRGLPVVLRIPAERGMLMASAIVGWLLVAAVSLLGLSAGLWTAGLGPAIRV